MLFPLYLSTKFLTLVSPLLHNSCLSSFLLLLPCFGSCCTVDLLHLFGFFVTLNIVKSVIPQCLCLPCLALSPFTSSSFCLHGWPPKCFNLSFSHSVSCVLWYFIAICLISLSLGRGISCKTYLDHVYLTFHNLIWTKQLLYTVWT